MKTKKPQLTSIQRDFIKEFKRYWNKCNTLIASMQKLTYSKDEISDMRKKFIKGCFSKIEDSKYEGLFDNPEGLFFYMNELGEDISIYLTKIKNEKKKV